MKQLLSDPLTNLSCDENHEEPPSAAARLFVLHAALLTCLSLVLLNSCKNDMQVIRSFSIVDTLPLEAAKDIEVIYSDSGRVKAILKGPLMNKYEKEAAMLIFPEGFELTFFDSAMTVRSTINAHYGKVDEKSNTMEARYNVVVVNRKKNEQLDTEHLVWDEKKQIIYSDVFVKITTPHEVIFGDGLVSNQDFSSYTIKNPHGEIAIKQEEE